MALSQDTEGGIRPGTPSVGSSFMHMCSPNLLHLLFCCVHKAEEVAVSPSNVALKGKVGGMDISKFLESSCALPVLPYSLRNQI